jgi:ABC-2 type transport system ATP-binding protein
MAAIETERLSRRFKGGLTAVEAIDLSVEAGEVYGFLGPNGAGKTTTVRMLVTLLRPTGGRAMVAGHDVARDPDAVRSGSPCRRPRWTA